MFCVNKHSGLSDVDSKRVAVVAALASACGGNRWRSFVLAFGTYIPSMSSTTQWCGECGGVV